MVERKTPAEIARMAEAGRLLARLHEHLAGAVAPGVTTGELDELAESLIRGWGAEPSFKGWHGYPATINASIGSEIVHGIPSPHRVLHTGDVLKLDAGVLLDGFHSDSACTYVVGGDETASPEVRALLADTREAMWAGIRRLVPGRRVGDVSAAIAEVGDLGGYGVVADHNGRVIGGHGIGRSLWEGPFVSNRGRRGRGLRLRPGLVLAVEPMFTLGGPGWRTLDDGWTIVSTDGSLAAHWEHTVAITDDGPCVLTARSDEPAWPLGPPATGRGVPRTG